MNEKGQGAGKWKELYRDEREKGTRRMMDSLCECVSKGVIGCAINLNGVKMVYVGFIIASHLRYQL